MNRAIQYKLVKHGRPTAYVEVSIVKKMSAFASLQKSIHVHEMLSTDPWGVLLYVHVTGVRMCDECHCS